MPAAVGGAHASDAGTPTRCRAEFSAPVVRENRVLRATGRPWRTNRSRDGSLLLTERTGQVHVSVRLEQLHASVGQKRGQHEHGYGQDDHQRGVPVQQMFRPVVRSDLHRARAEYAPREERLGERRHPTLKNNRVPIGVGRKRRKRVDGESRSTDGDETGSSLSRVARGLLRRPNIGNVEFGENRFRKLQFFLVE